MSPIEMRTTVTARSAATAKARLLIPPRYPIGPVSNRFLLFQQHGAEAAESVGVVDEHDAARGEA
jgi:hypothetical protein